MGKEAKFFKNASTKGSKLNIKKFSWDNYLRLWKMEAILIQENCVTLKSETSMPINLIQSQKTEMTDKTESAIIILCIRDKVLREVWKEKIVAWLWTKSELLYIT